MDFLTNHLLTLILFTPLVGALVLGFLANDKKTIRWAGFLFSLVPLALTLLLWARFDFAQAAAFQFQEQATWYGPIHASYHLGVDGVALTMVLLTTFLTPLALLASFSVNDRVKVYYMLFLALETGMLGVFLSLDLMLFFVFWEIGLVPMFFLIFLWGSPKGERHVWPGLTVPSRVYAAFKFMIYTMAGSLGLLLAIQMLGVVTGTFDLPTVIERWNQASGTILGFEASTLKAMAFWAFAIAFALKVPVWPFHTWLPDAHTEAPTAGSMILAGVLLKLGAFGFLRFVLPLYPEQARHYAVALAFMGMMAIIFGAFAAWGQEDFKRLVAYSSVNHMGFVVLAIAAAAWAAGTEHATIALNGAVLQMFNHGLTAAGMFFLVGAIYERAHTRELKKFGGLFGHIPVYAGVLVFTSMASLGLPGLNSFVSEFLIVRGAWPVFSLFTALSMLGLLITGAYILKGIKDVLFGPLTDLADHLTDLTAREVAVMVPLMALMLILGVWPMWLLEVINRAVGG